ncbi:MAG: NAD(P)-dependent oxidoreductase [Candidatus Levyibacteriota bacterium]|nr:MAG: NAD(P)-dependent oxidoreductase [Candidatus Levybacteria bacterium]
MKHSYLVTGGFGLIGSTLINSLDGDVVILSRTRKNEERVIRQDVKILLKDLNSLRVNDLKNIDIIYHCAGTVDNYHVLTDPYIDVKTNINGTINLLECCRKLQIPPKIICLSTFFVYGNEYTRTKNPINEDSKTDPLALYPITKLASESIIKLYSRLFNIPYLICRLTNVYGEKEDFSNSKKGALNFLIMKAIKGEKINVYSGGEYYRDYIFVKDVVSALQFLEEKSVNDTFLIGYGKPILFKDIISYLHQLTDKKSEIGQIDPPEFHKIVGITDFIADTSKINSLGWFPSIDYKEGLKIIVERYKSLLKHR